ncbi:aldo/keto reductase [Aestuariibacter sp. GS-14]|uniref:aldo/keto reductase n=1 Tax=Aestuariibacter sp. GS-14 TaxID=2590670 RepID=UPI001125BF29|nr:aldo/keto reductase [Aestuariibacter sp. GS-14]TPV58547.1 aldo/keto reductase [Aestuariibacter sp. GS-14]
MENKPNTVPERRQFIRNIAIAGTGIAASLASASAVAGYQSAPGCSTAVVGNNTRKLGELTVSPIGLGCMSMSSGSYNPPRSAKDMVPVIRGAVERGVTFFDTAEVYGPFTNEEIVGEALQPVRNDVVLASKFGFKFENGQRAGRDSRPDAIRTAVEGMLKRLRTDRIDLLYLHRVDPNVPVEEVAGAVGELIKEGKARYFGLSEVSPTTLRKAHAEYPVTAVQSEYSIMERSVENQVLATCEELGIGFVPWGSVCRGFLADKFDEYSRFSEPSRFVSVPYFTPEAIEKNMAILNLVREWGAERGMSPVQFAIAWLLSVKPFIVPIPGTTKLHHLEEDIGAIHTRFSDSEMTMFRKQFEQLDLMGFRAKDAALTDK